MKFNDFKKLEKKINGENFNQSYKLINTVLTGLSYFGHLASIGLAYFMLSKVLLAATDNMFVVGLASIIILVGLESIKRSLFDKFSISYLKSKAFTKEVIPLFLLSFFVISMSFYASIKGAAEFSSKSEKIENESKITIQTYNDSISKIYNNDILQIENDVKSKDEILTNLQSLALTQKLSKDQRTTITDLTTQKKDLKLQIDEKKSELKTKLEEHKKGVTDEVTGQKQNNESSSLTFVIISTIIEFTILAGVYFGEYYKFRSYREYRDKIEKEPSFQKWLLYNEMLDVIYTEDTKINQRLPSGKAIIDMCRANNIIILPKDMANFLKIITGLNIIKISGSAKYFNKTKEVSDEILRKHFNIE